MTYLIALPYILTSYVLLSVSVAFITKDKTEKWSVGFKRGFIHCAGLFLMITSLMALAAAMYTLDQILK